MKSLEIADCRPARRTNVSEAGGLSISDCVELWRRPRVRYGHSAFRIRCAFHLSLDCLLHTAYFRALLFFMLMACNPFAPGLDNNPTDAESLLGDPATVDGVYQNIRYAYTFRDTTIYGQLVGADFFFTFRDYERGVDVTWGRDEEMRITQSLFDNIQRIDLLWNNVLSMSVDSTETFASVSRNFSLTVTFNQSDIQRADGYATFTLSRSTTGEPWRITRWRDDSNF